MVSKLAINSNTMSNHDLMCDLDTADPCIPTQVHEIIETLYNIVQVKVTGDHWKPSQGIAGALCTYLLLKGFK